MTATFWTGSSLSFTNGSKTVTVNTGPSLDSVKANSSLTAGNYNEPVEVKSVSGNTITLYNNWPGSTGTTSATIKPSAAAAASAGVAAQQLITDIQSLVGSASATATANSFVKRTSNGRIKASAGAATDDVVVQSQLGTAAAMDVTTSRLDTDQNHIMKVRDFGLGDRIATGYPSDNLDDATVPCGFYRLVNGAPSMGTRPEGFSDYAYCQAQTYDINSKLQTVVDVTGKKAYRVFSNTNTDNWIYDYNSSNTNFNRFQGDAENDYVLPNSGKGRNTNIVRFLINLNSVASPSSITTSPLTQFALVAGGQQAPVNSSINSISLSPTSSRKALVLEVTLVDSVVTVGESYALRCNVGNTFIEVNY